MHQIRAVPFKKFTRPPREGKKQNVWDADDCLPRILVYPDVGTNFQSNASGNFEDWLSDGTQLYVRTYIHGEGRVSVHTYIQAIPRKGPLPNLCKFRPTQ